MGSDLSEVMYVPKSTRQYAWKFIRLVTVMDVFPHKQKIMDPIFLAHFYYNYHVHTYILK